jgi:hypothetical protein
MNTLTSQFSGIRHCIIAGFGGDPKKGGDPPHHERALCVDRFKITRRAVSIGGQKFLTW